VSSTVSTRTLIYSATGVMFVQVNKGVLAMSRELDLVQFDTAHTPRPHVNALIREHMIFTPEQRLEAAKRGGWNVFRFPSKMLRGGDLLSDSGTTTLSVIQKSYADQALGDSAYGYNWGYEQLHDVCLQTFGISEKDFGMYFFHQGRTAEHALYSHVNGARTIPSNSFFDTTRANAEANGIAAKDLPDTTDPIFKGNIDLEQGMLKKYHHSMPFVLMTVTNNTGGGQPVSMQNIKTAAFLAHAHNTSFFLDACRFAENAWFIKRYETGYKEKSILEIVHEMFGYCDGCIISFKKDGLSNMGGGLFIRKNCPLIKAFPNLLETLYDHQILTEGHESQGGMPESIILTIVKGLQRVIQDDYLSGRIHLVRDFGAYVSGLGVPIIEPVGGHAVYIDVDRFFADTKMRREDFGGISLIALLLLKGVRLCELGAFAFGVYNPKTKKETLPERNYVRAAVPRNKYEEQDLFYVADCVKELYDRRHELPKAIPIYGRDKTLRHFKARFELQYS
jgi:tyrosine phenol-lyase